MGDKYKGPDYSDVAESMATVPYGFGKAATGAVVKSMQSRMSKKKKQNEYYDPDAGRSARVKMADKAPKIDLRKSYPE